MRTPEQFLVDLDRRLARTWHADVAGAASSWPHTFPLGEAARPALESDFTEVRREVLSWREWARSHDLLLTMATRKVHGTAQQIPSHVTVESIDAAARVLGSSWTARITNGRARAEVLASRFPAVTPPAALATLVRAVDTMGEADFDLLCTAADWFAVHDASDLTPRQVPIEGLHAKWLNTNQWLVQALSGRPDLGLRPPHPSRVHFTYLDPEHLAGGGRVHDSATVGDCMQPAYRPRVVVISENKDTAICFPSLPGAIAIEGAGYGGASLAAFSWIVGAPHLLYWGDMDAEGYEILNGFRADGVPAESMLMDLATFTAYAQFGAVSDSAGQPIKVKVRKELPLLTDGERAVYEQVTDPQWLGVRRVEQERISLAVARKVVLGRV